MEKISYDEVISGYKKSLQALKKIDEETYNVFMANIQKFSKQDILKFFECLEQDANKSGSIVGARGVLSVSKKEAYGRHAVHFSETRIFYDKAFNLHIQVFNSGISSNCCHDYSLLPLLENVEAYSDGAGTVFFEKSTNNVLNKNTKLYYGIKKVKNGLEIFVQDLYNNQIKEEQVKTMPSGEECGLIK